MWYVRLDKKGSAAQRRVELHRKYHGLSASSAGPGSDDGADDAGEVWSWRLVKLFKTSVDYGRLVLWGRIKSRPQSYCMGVLWNVPIVPIIVDYGRLTIWRWGRVMNCDWSRVYTLRGLNIFGLRHRWTKENLFNRPPKVLQMCVLRAGPVVLQGP